MAYLVPRVSFTAPIPLQEVAPVTSVSGTVTGSAGFGSSLFLSRIFIPGEMALTEAQAAIGMAFPNTSQGAGTLSRSLVIYSFGNSTSLASLASVSGTSAWTTGTTTAGASTSLTQFQGGWSGNVLQAMTFASQVIQPGDYVIGQLFNFAQASSTWSVSMFGLASNSLTSGSLSAASTFATGSSGITGFTVAPTAVNVTSQALSAASAITGIASIATGVAGNTNWLITHASSAVSSASQSFSTGTYTLAQVGQVNALSTVAGSFITGTTAAAALSNAGTAAMSLAASLTTNSVGAVTAAGTATSLPNFAYIGQGASTIVPSQFVNGVMSTGAVPASIALSAVTMSGTAAMVQPYFALVGA